MSTVIGTRNTLLIAASSALLLAVIFLVTGMPSWSWASIFVLAGITSVGAFAAPGDRAAGSRRRGA